MGALEEIEAKLAGLNPQARQEIARMVARSKAEKPWTPNPGPQTDAYFSKADILLYGGRAGGGKTHLLIGWGANEADNGIIFRRELGQTDGLEKEGKTMLAGWNGQDHEWNWGRGKSLKLGGMKEADSWMAHAGRERDYIAFDEGGEFIEVQIASSLAWLRAPPGRRARLIIASNPPRTSEGRWLLEWFAPWLDYTHPLYPAHPGDLLWAVYVSKQDGSGDTIWVDGPGEYQIEGETYTARSRTFIPASLEDNPFRNTPEYRATLQSLPEPLRSQLLYGDWTAGQADAANQCIPTAWIKAAFQRWQPKPPAGVPMCALGVDCSGGGTDPLVIVPRHDAWFGESVKVEAQSLSQDALGSATAGEVVKVRRDGALVVVDMGGGYGGSVQEHCKSNGIDVFPYRGAEKSERRSKQGKYRFTNTRSAAYWAFREALDPGQPGGSPVAMKESPKLLAGLAAPTFEVTPHGIKVEPKIVRNEKGKITGGVIAKLGWSPDEADAHVMCWFAGPKEVTHALEWAENRQRKRAPQVLLSRSAQMAQRRQGVRT